MANYKKKETPGEGGSPYQPYKPKPSGPYVPAPGKKLAKGKSIFSTPGLDDLRNLNKFRENADKVFKRKKKPSTNGVNEA